MFQFNRLSLFEAGIGKGPQCRTHEAGFNNNNNNFNKVKSRKCQIPKAHGGEKHEHTKLEKTL